MNPGDTCGQSAASCFTAAALKGTIHVPIFARRSTPMNISRRSRSSLPRLCATIAGETLRFAAAGLIFSLAALLPYSALLRFEGDAISGTDLLYCYFTGLICWGIFRLGVHLSRTS